MKRKIVSLFLVCALVFTAFNPVADVDNGGIDTYGIFDWSTGAE